MNSEVLRIDIWSDLVCPWCWIGKHRLQRALAQLEGTIPAPVIYWHPFKLDPEAGTTPVPLREAYVSKFGSVERTTKILAQTQATAQAEGLPMDFDQGQVRVTTRFAHRLLWLASREAVVDSVAEALFHAHFAQGKNLADRNVLIEAASMGGLDPARAAALLDSNEAHTEVEAELQQAHARGIHAVPLFMINQDQIIQGAQSPEFFSGALQQAAAKIRSSTVAQGNQCGPDNCMIP